MAATATGVKASVIGKPAQGVRSRAKYVRASGNEAADSEDEAEWQGLDERERQKRIWVKRLDKAWRKVQAVGWIAAACWFIWWTNMFRVMWESPDVAREYLYAGLGCLAFNMSLLFYIAIYVEAILGQPETSAQLIEKLAPVMAAVGLATFLVLTRAFWPVWGWLVLPLQFTLFMGFINTGHFLPKGSIGSILTFAIFIGPFFTSELIPHEGLAHNRY